MALTDLPTPGWAHTRGQGINPAEFERSTYTQFQTWLSETKSSEGCPVNCTYCFFKLDGQTPARPVISMSAADTVADIARQMTYHPTMSVHFGSQTDICATPANIKHYTEVLTEYARSELPNPLVLITKRRIPRAFAELAKALPQPVVFFISCSGLAGTPLEPTVRADDMVANFRLLQEIGVPAVHYWRPFTPQNSSDEDLKSMLDMVSELAVCSTVNGLKLNSGILEHVRPSWPELSDLKVDFAQSGEFWPEGVRSKLLSLAAKEYPGYAVHLDTACALAYALGAPDIQGIFGTTLCSESQCPTMQRELCVASLPRLTRAEVEQAVQGLGLGLSADSIRVVGNEVVLDAVVPVPVLTYLRTVLRSPVRVAGLEYGGHNWASTLDSEVPFVEVPWTPAPRG